MIVRVLRKESLNRPKTSQEPWNANNEKTNRILGKFSGKEYGEKDDMVNLVCGLATGGIGTPRTRLGTPIGRTRRANSFTPVVTGRKLEDPKTMDNKETLGKSQNMRIQRVTPGTCGQKLNQRMRSGSVLNKYTNGSLD